MSKARLGSNLFEEKGAFLFKYLPMPSYAWQMVDNDLILINYNDAAYEFTKGNIENYMNIKATELYNDYPEILADLIKCAREKSNFFKEMKYGFKSVGIEKYLSVNYGFIPPDIVMVHTNDITEKKLAKLKHKGMGIKPDESEMKLMKSNENLERKISRDIKKEAELKLIRSEYQLRGRVKELSCLYQISKIFNIINISIDDILYNITNLLPAAFQYPNIISARLRLKNLEFRTINFKETEWKISSKEIIKEKPLIIDIYYLEEKPFLEEEIFLLNEIARRLKDFLEKKEAEQRLKESEEKFRTLTEQSFLGIAILQDNLIKYVNETLAKMFSYSIDDVMTWNVGQFLNVIHPEDREFVAKQAMKKQLGEPGAINQYQFRGLKKNGEIIWLEVFSKTINYQEKPADFVAIFDITEKKFGEEALKTEKKFTEDVINTTSDTIFVFEPETGKAIRWNKAFSDITGYTDEEIYSMKAPESYYDEDDLMRAAEATNKISEEGEVTIEMSLITKDGRSIPFEYSGRSFKTSDGRDLIVSIGRDIKERREAEKKIANLAKFPSENPNPVLRVNSDNVLYINQAGQALFNISDGDKIPSILQKNINSAFLQNKPQTYEFSVNNRFYGFDITPILETKYANIYGKDITNRKEAEVKMRESEEKYRNAYDRANIYKDLFAHDINNILQVINSSAELINHYMNSSEKNEEIITIAEMIKKQVSRAKLLVHNVNTLSELEEGTKPIKLIEVYELLQNSANYIRTAYKERAIDVSIECFSNRIFVQANELLKEVFDNVLTNAVKYNDKSLIEILVNVSKEKKGDKKYLKFEFIDNGIGIQDEKKDNIFKRGHREAKGQKGMGLGLSLVKKILEGFDGEIYVENRVKDDYTQGSKFVILIPEAP